MAALQSRANRLLSNLPFSLVKRKFGSSRLISQKHSEEIQVGNGLLSFETGEIAQFANGSVFISMGETNVLSTIVSGKGDAIKDFLPLTVDYMEKKYAQGVIPGTFNRREGPPRERELLVGRVIDRSIRPLFPAGFYTDVQVMASVLSSDGKYDPDVMAANATSAALMISDIPWAGPVGVIRIGRVDGKLITNPTMEELMLGDLNLVYSCIRDKTMMIEMQSRGISERDLDAALRQAQREAEQILEPQIRLAAKVGKQKRVYKLSTISNRTMEKVKSLSEAPIEAVFTDPTYGKFERGEALDKITQNVRKVLDEECDEESLQVLPKAVDSVRKQIVRKRILEKELRVDGRRLDEVRPLYSRCGNLPSVRGSSLFSRGDTQVLSAVTLGAPGDAQRLDSLVGPSTKHFMLHYSFPPYSINEIGKVGGLNRREVGHEAALKFEWIRCGFDDSASTELCVIPGRQRRLWWYIKGFLAWQISVEFKLPRMINCSRKPPDTGNLAEKALIGVLPKTNEYAYSIRVNSEVMASDGSTSMATVCAGSLALMHAGVPIEEHVAGLSIGLVSEIDPSTGMIKDYRILTDILGLEDHLGDIDFKIAGTKKAVTAIQLDMKPAGIPLEIICQCLEPALKGRLQIIDHMEQVITSPRHEFDRNSPQIVTLKFHNDSLWRLIGPQGVRKRKIEEETGARISIGEGTLSVHAKNQTSLEKALEKVIFIP
ncbi:hypothetical protein GIB67_005689 [Kingdonia uniflora]|uniref:polyribonucleotide nucleotidyltransferase n=1 Tax=Kingdonia uniflora TaxID=39325 RepID=A0A7J7NIA6_9MAGN|nr:hypothetical protein GIB67_005689 [Kingdonia uniflora]